MTETLIILKREADRLAQKEIPIEEKVLQLESALKASKAEVIQVKKEARKAYIFVALVFALHIFLACVYYQAREPIEVSPPEQEITSN